MPLRSLLPTLALGLAAGTAAPFLAAPLAAGEYNAALSIGDAAPAWGGLPGTDGKTHALADRDEPAAVVVAFTCNTCPYAADVEDRLAELAKEFADRKVAVIAINCNAGDQETLDAMKARAAERKLGFTYLKDEGGLSGAAFGATRTPEFFVIDGAEKIAYMGALDDSPEGKNVTKPYVADAVRAILDGKAPPVAETPPIGCLIKYPRGARP